VSALGGRLELTDSEGDALNLLAAETVLQPVEDFLLPITNDFVEPRVIIDRNEERAGANAGGLRMGGDPGVNGCGPNPHNFGFGPSLFQP